jgi:FtsP/CotA-like multicopper oxidase with cupredoxin domain
LPPVKQPLSLDSSGNVPWAVQPTKQTCAGELPRPDHQRWEEFLPKKFYDMHVQKVKWQFHSDYGPSANIFGFDGICPGPTFHARYNDPILVRIFNDIDPNHTGFGVPSISTHLHNLHSPSESDGFPGYFFDSGVFKDYHYCNGYAGYNTFHHVDRNGVRHEGDPREALGTLWYHDHRQDFTAQNVYRGLAGFYLLFDDWDSGNEEDRTTWTDEKGMTQQAFGLPSGKYDVPLVFQDKLFDSNADLFFDFFNLDGMLGDKFTVNGCIQPYFEVDARKYRFRFLDGGPSRFYEFWLMDANGKYLPFDYYISNDGNLLPAPILNKQSVRIGVAERGDVVIDFSKYAGQKLYLVNRLEQTGGRGPTGKLLNPGIPLVEFRVGAKVADPSRVPNVLRALPDIPADAMSRPVTRHWEFNRRNGQWTVNKQIYDETARASIPQGSEEIWVLKNGGGGWSHPIHIHFEEGRILTRNGKAPALHEAGRKDVYTLGPGDEVKIFLRFRDFKGQYVMHCHNVVHEDHAMMIRWDIT